MRPEHLALVAPGAGLPAIVEVIEPTGSETQVYARIDTQPIVAVLRERLDARPGEVIHLARIYLFDKASGRNLLERS